MKKNYLIILSVFVWSFFIIRSFSYQPPVKLFQTAEPTNAGPTNEDKNVPFAFEKGANGTDSFVLIINNLSQFLSLGVGNNKPIFLRISNKEQLKDMFQEVALSFKEDALFVSVDALKNWPLVQILSFVLKSKGVNLPELKDCYPMFMFCSPNFVVLQDNSLSFNKDNLRLLAIRNVNKSSLSARIQKVLLNFKKPAAVGDQEQGRSEKGNFWKKVKSWFKK